MPGISVGYARVSTVDQQAGLDAQLRDLKAAGCEEIFSERVSAVRVSGGEKPRINGASSFHL
jgi:DNA invertase Pin-like site-specific DNA recombinase